MLGVKRGDSLPFKGWSHSSTRSDLLKIFARLGYTKGAEIGVAEGQFSIEMLDTIPDLRLTCVDPWQAYDRTSQRICDERRKRAFERLAGRNVEILVATSLEASKQVEDNSLDFCYVDGAHDFDNAMLDTILWSKKVRRGGIVAGHDFYPFYKAGVMDAVYAYTRAHRINDWYVTWEKTASWFWIKGKE